MGIAAWFVWREHGFRGASTALKLFFAQLFANALDLDILCLASGRALAGRDRRSVVDHCKHHRSVLALA